MSDFSLSKVAPYLGKDARTIRRWCERSIIPNAFQTKGGHWRIKGESPQSIARSFVKPENSRQRRENAFPPGFENSGLTNRQSWSDAGEIDFALSRHKRVAFVGGHAYPIDTKRQKIEFLRAFFERDAEAWFEDVEDVVGKYIMRTGRFYELPEKLRFWTPQRIAALVGWSPRSLYRHFPDWRNRLRKRALKCYQLIAVGAEYVPAETWGRGDQDSFYDAFDRRAGG
jgi:hypothetical protein